MNPTLAAWNNAGQALALDAMLACCGAHKWAEAMVAARPIGTVKELSETADSAWSKMTETDWLQAFACHPRIGARKSGSATGRSSVRSAHWSLMEQSSANAASSRVLRELAECNDLYEQYFGFTYIIRATGKSADEMLSILKRRLASDRATELREAAEQQRQIMQIRLGKWLVE